VGGVSQEVVNLGRTLLEVENGLGIRDDELSASNNGLEGWDKLFGTGDIDLVCPKIFNNSGRSVESNTTFKGLKKSSDIPLKVSHVVGKLRT